MATYWQLEATLDEWEVEESVSLWTLEEENEAPGYVRLATVKVG